MRGLKWLDRQAVDLSYGSMRLLLALICQAVDTRTVRMYTVSL